MAARETQATRAARGARIAFNVREYAHDAGAPAFGLEAAEKLGLDPARVFKTLLVDADGGLIALTGATTARLT